MYQKVRKASKESARATKNNVNKTLIEYLVR